MLPCVGMVLLRVQDRPILALLACLVHASDPVFNQIDSAVSQSFPAAPQAHLSPYQANGPGETKLLSGELCFPVLETPDNYGASLALSPSQLTERNSARAGVGRRPPRLA